MKIVPIRTMCDCSGERAGEPGNVTIALRWSLAET
jgi:hypothetical protein